MNKVDSFITLNTILYERRKRKISKEEKYIKK